MYHYAGNNPVKYTDPDGEAIETGWDVFSLVTGVASLIADVKAGNVKGAVIDSFGIIADTVAVALPCIPGGAGTAIKAARFAGAAANVAGGALSVQDGIANGDYLEAGLGVLQAASGVGRLSKVVFAGAKSKTVRTPNQIGKDGESAVKSVHDIGEKSRILINGRTRIPDGLKTGVLSEVKNTKRQAFTTQLHDFLDYAEANNMRMDLYTRPNTVLTGPLQEAIEAGRINLRIIPE